MRRYPRRWRFLAKDDTIVLQPPGSRVAPHGLERRGHPEPDLEGQRPLARKHAETIGRAQAAGPGSAEKGRLGRGVHRRPRGDGRRPAGTTRPPRRLTASPGEAPVIPALVACTTVRVSFSLSTRSGDHAWPGRPAGIAARARTDHVAHAEVVPEGPERGPRGPPAAQDERSLRAPSPALRRGWRAHARAPLRRC